MNETDGTFTHKPVVRKGLNDIPKEVDSSGRIQGINRLGEDKPRAVLGRNDEPAGTEHFEHDPNYSWSSDSRSEGHEENSDQFITSQIQKAFTAHQHELDSSGLELRVENGIIFISGQVSSQKEIVMVNQIVGEIYGVTGTMITIGLKNNRDYSQGILSNITHTDGPIKGLH